LVAEGPIAINAPREQLLRTIAAFRRGGGEGKPLYLQVHLSYARSDAEARANAFDQWRTPILSGHVNEYLRLPRQFEAAAGFARLEEMNRFARTSSDAERRVPWARDDHDLGFPHVCPHNVRRNQRESNEAVEGRAPPWFD
jgi:hypothetical protein